MIGSLQASVDFLDELSQASALPTDTNVVSFYEFCKSQIKYSEKNVFMQARLNSKLEKSFNDSCISFSQGKKNEEELLKAIEDRRKKRETQQFRASVKCKIDPCSCLIFFIAHLKEIKHVIPDYEMQSCKEYFCSVIQNNPNCHEAYFGLARLSSYEGKYIEALNYINLAIAIYQDPLYIKLSLVLEIKCKKNNVLSASSSCLNPCITSIQQMEFWRLENLSKSVEAYWISMEFAKLGVEIEAAEYYATCIKEIDQYLGYLAWGDLFLESNREKGLDIMHELIRKYPARPEAYAKLWNYYYYQLSNYEAAEDISTMAFLRVTEPEYDDYYIVFSLACAKSYFKTGKVSSALHLLQKKFLENSEYPIFLYHFGRFSCKSQDNTFVGEAISALKECARICSPSMLGCIYYWLSRAYMQNRHHIEAYKYLQKGLAHSNSLKRSKKQELRLWANDMEFYISLIRKAEKYLDGEFYPAIIEECYRIIEKLNEFHKVSSDILNVKILWKLGNKIKAIEELKKLCDLCGSRETAYPLLIKYLKAINEYGYIEKTALRLIAYCKNTSVPIEFWVKVNILYAKALAKNGKPSKSILILKSIAKVFTPLPYLKIPYTRALQRATSSQELMNPNSLNFHQYDSYKSSFSNSREFSTKVIIENETLQSPAFKRRPERTLTEGLRSSRRLQLNLEDNTENGSNQSSNLLTQSTISEKFIGISVYSKPRFLYLLAKLSLNFSISLDEGLFAIKDFLEISRFRIKNRKADTYIQKAEMIKNLLRSKKQQPN